MNEELLARLKVISAEEQSILNGEPDVQQSIYSSAADFIVDSEKMLQKGKLIDIRPHTRFVQFPKHRHNYIEIVYMCSGTSTHIINDKEQVVLESGDLLFLSQNACQEIMPAGLDDIAVNFIVLPEFFDIAFSMIQCKNVLHDFFIGALSQKKGAVDYIHFKVSDVKPIQNLMENMIWSFMEAQGNHRQINQITMGLLFLHILSYVDRIVANTPLQYEQSLVFAVMQYLEENYKNGSLTELAAQLNQPLTSLSRLIKANTGHTFKDLLQKKRLGMSVFLLLSTDCTLEEIIDTVGYENSSYFYRIFRKEYGVTPHKFKLANKDGKV